ncbi:tetratricopeptide repeat protein [Novilysobacter arseniciresistens]|uniref:tetratricopeptide repeat protein n=1 Tax=Novilysobacter arseniciresistens TaxID=1385522 RepID=UPI00068AC746|nr:tetratricopeptide repeat protein [Lysobacter arseniciresistens]
MKLRFPCLCLAAALAAGCASGPAAPERPAFDAAAALAAIEQAGASASDELVVRPLGNPQVQDLRADADALLRQGRHDEAAALLDQALAISPDDPALLQERAETALWQGDLDLAGRRARQAAELGAGVGPLCRRHWETVAQVAQAQAPAGIEPATGAATAAPAVSAARAQRDACTVTPPPRY